jgi:hypothetical protein
MPSLKDKTVLDRAVSAASARARGGYADLTASLVNALFSTKVTGPMMLAKHSAGKLASDGSFLFALTNSFLAGQALHIDGGEPLT